MNNSTFAEQILSQIPAEAPSFPQANYDPDGDYIEFILSPESYYAKRLDCLTTVYLGQESGQVVGSLITGVRHFVAQILKSSPGFQVEIQDGRIRLEHLFTAKLWSERTSNAQEEVRLYQFLRKKAEEANAEVVFPELAAA